MEIYVRKRGRSSSGPLAITFVLGFAIGFSICYSFVGGKGAAPAPEPVVENPSTAPLVVPETPAPAPTPETPPPPPPPPPPPEEKPVISTGDAIWPGRFMFVAVEGLSLSDEAKALLKEVRPGGVVLGQDNVKDAEQTANLVKEIKEAEGLGGDVWSLPLIAVAQEGGACNVLGVEKAPSAEDLGKDKTAAPAREAGETYAQAALQRGIGVVLAPVLNVPEGSGKAGDKTPPMLATDRCFSMDKSYVALSGLALAEGIRNGGAIAVAKFFPGIGKPRKVAGGMQWVLGDKSERLAELMYPFAEAGKEGVPGIIVGPAAVPELDQQDAKRPAALSPVLVSLVLREKLDFGGVILADDVTAKSMTVVRPADRAVVEALQAGCDAVMALDPKAESLRSLCKAIQDALDKGTLARDKLDASRQRLDAWSYRLAKKEPPAKAPEPIPAPVVTPEPPKPEEAKPVAKVEIVESKPAEPDKAEAVEAKPAETAKVEIVEATPPPKPAPEPPAPAPEPLSEDAPEEPRPVVTEQGPAIEPAPEMPAEKPAPIPIPPPPAEPAVNPAPAAEPAPPPAPSEQPAVVEAKPPEPAAPEKAQEAVANSSAQPPNSQRVIHVVERGDTINKLAAKYGVRAKDIKEWNGLTSEKVLLGSKLVIYTSASPASGAEAASEGGASPDTAKRVHVVGNKETLAKIAAQYGVTTEDLMAWNGLMSEGVVEGQKLTVFTPGEAKPKSSGETTIHKVAKGESIYKIAAKYQTTVKKIIEMNKLESPDRLLEGQRLIVPQKP